VYDAVLGHGGDQAGPHRPGVLAEPLVGRREQGLDPRDLARAEQRPRGLDDEQRCGLLVALGPEGLHRLLEEVGRATQVAARRRGEGRVPQQLRKVVVGRQRERLLGVREGHLGRTERQRALGRPPQPLPGRRRDVLGLRGARLGAVGLEVVVRHHAGELVVGQRLEVPSSSQVPHPSGRLGEHRVRHLAQDALDEAELAALRRAWVEVLHEQLTPDERAQPGLDLLGGAAGHAGQSGDGERLPEDGRVLQERAVGVLERVHPRGEQRVQRLRDVELAHEAADHSVRTPDLLEHVAVGQHADGLDGVQRDALGPGDDAVDVLGRQAGHVPADHRGHLRVRERVEVEDGRAAQPGPPGRPAVGELGAGQRDDEQR
jgi:hypothetical protein